MSYTIFPNQSSTTLPSDTAGITVPNGGYTVGGAGSSAATWTTGVAMAPPIATSAKINANGKMELHGDDADLIINGQSLNKTMQTIQDRLAILIPDPKKLEQFEALKQAYEHYKTLEALCCESTTPESDK